MSNLSYIENIEIAGLWGRANIHWQHINADVNILVGINGSGKTTLLNLIEAYYNDDKKELKKQSGTISGKPQAVYPITFIRSFDVPASGKKKTTLSPLMQELDDVILQNKGGISFFNYRMKMLDYPKNATRIQQQIDSFFQIVNQLFADTQKTIAVDRDNGTLVFKYGNTSIPLEALSSGEKQMLLVLLRVFLMEEEPSILLMDEPEISMHISWQRQLIDVIRKLNPQCQLILSTHSPSIFGKGWGDKVVYMEKLMSLQ